MKKMNTFLRICILVMFVAVVFSGCKKNEDPYAAYTPAREATLISEWLAQMAKDKKEVKTTATGINYVVAKEGTGDLVSTGKTLVVKYTRTYTNGSVFDSSAFYGDGTYTYIHKDTDLTKRMIQGWEEGIEVMRKGGIATFLFPSSKAYGSTGAGPIPPNSPLLFVIEVVDIK